MSSGLKRISGARKRSGPSYKPYGFQQRRDGTFEDQTDLNGVPVGQAELLCPCRGVLLFFGWIEGDVATFFLDSSDDLSLGCCMEMMASFTQKQLQVVCDISGNS